MSEMTVEQELITTIQAMDVEQQRRMLEYAHSLKQPVGEPGWLFIERTQHIQFDPQDLAEMEQAIEEWSERIDDFPEVNFDE